MKYHLSPSTQQAKDTAFNRNSQSRNVGQALMDSTPSPSLASPHQLRSPEHISLFQLLLLLFSLTALLVFLVSLVIHHYLQRGHTIAIEDPSGVRKLRKRRPSSLNLHADVEAQRKGSGSRKSFDLSEDKSGDEMGKILEDIVVASGFYVKALAPSDLLFRKKANSTGCAGIENWDRREEYSMTKSPGSPMGLGKYFHSDGVGIIRYESGTMERDGRTVSKLGHRRTSNMSSVLRRAKIGDIEV